MLGSISKISVNFVRKRLRYFNSNQCYNKKDQIKKVVRRNNENRQRKVDLSMETDILRSVFPEVREEVVNEQLIYQKDYPCLRERYIKLLNYTVNLEYPYISRATAFVHAYRLLEKPFLLTEDSLRKAAVLGWAHKMIDASVLIDDDVADIAETRYNKPAWYKLEGVGIEKAVLDAAFVETSANILLVNHFWSHPQFYNIAKQVLLSFAYTNVAQLTQSIKRQLSDMGKYNDHVGSYMFTVPTVASALYLANIDDKEIHKASEELCKDIAVYIKNADDAVGVLCPSTTGKTSTDVHLGRNTWVAVEAYKKSNDTQRKALEDHYGKNNEESVAIVNSILEDLQMRKMFEEYRQEFYEKTHRKIHEDLPKSLPPQLFIDLLDLALSGEYLM